MLALCSFFIINYLKNRQQLKFFNKIKGGRFYILLIAGSLMLTLLCALLPSSKIDEIYYHMLIPQRIILDHGIKFYQMPWESAVMPQNYFQLSFIGLHGIGQPDAPNMVSYLVNALMVWSAYVFLRKYYSQSISFLIISIFIGGLYALVFRVTGSASAFGDLAIFAAILFSVEIKNLSKQYDVKSVVFAQSVFLMGCSMAKVTMLPLIAILFLYLLWDIYKSRVLSLSFFSWFFTSWLIFYFPLVIWTFINSGSPFGPVLAEHFSGSVYKLSTLQDTILKSKELNSGAGLVTSLKTLFTFCSPFVIGGYVFIWFGKLDREFKIRLTVLLFFQIALCILFNFASPFELRFFSNTQNAFFILALAYFSPQFKNILAKVEFQWAILIFTALPWLALQLYYTYYLMPLPVKNVQKHFFYKKYIAFYSDFKALNQTLPKNAVFLVEGIRAGNVYFPRKVYLSVDDINSNDEEIFLFKVGAAGENSKIINDKKYLLGKQIYYNPKAISTTFRTPGQQPYIDTLRVYKLNR